MSKPLDIHLENGLGNGRLFAQQRLLIYELTARSTNDYERDMLEGLSGLLDEIADQAHDRYGIDCLIKDSDSLTNSTEVSRDY